MRVPIRFLASQRQQNSIPARLCLGSLWLTLLLSLVLSGVGVAQEGPMPTPVGAQASPSNSPTPVSTGDLSVLLESAQQLVQEISSRYDSDTSTVDIEPQVTSLSQEMSAKLEALDALLKSKPAIGDIRAAEIHWGKLQSTIRQWKSRLDSRGREVDEDIAKLDKAQKSWSGLVPPQSDLPQPLTDSIRSTEAQLLSLSSRLRRSQLDSLTLLARVARLDSTVQDNVERLARARKERLATILTLDSEPIWRVDFSQLSWASLSNETWQSLTNQVRSLSNYASSESGRFFGHAVSVLLLFGVLYSVQARVRLWMAQEESLQEQATAFDSPLLIVALFSTPIGLWFYQEPPPILTAILIAAALLPAFVVLRRLVGKQLHPTLYAIATLYCFDTLRLITAPQVLLNRILFSVQFGGALVYLIWRIVFHPLPAPWASRVRAFLAMLFGCTLVAVNVGFVRLAYTAGDASLDSLYLGALLVPLVRICDGINLVLQRTRLFQHLQSAANTQPINLKWWIRALAIFFWAQKTLEFLGVRQSAIEWLQSVLDSSLRLGALELRLGGLIGFGIALWFPYRISGMVRAVLEEAVFPKLELSRGAVYTVSTAVHYLLLITGALIGLGILGLDLAKFTIVASALGVGIGFGLQNIFNNFVSGLILMLERPIQVGHVIEVSGQVGRLERIGLRASVIRTADGSEIIIPNGELLSTRVTNWTLSDQRRLLRIPVGVSYNSSPTEVSKLLLESAKAHPKVLSLPEPEVHMLNLGDSALEFELRAWTNDFDRWQQTRSQLLCSVFEKLSQAGIDIPYPQRTLHIQPEALAQPNPETKADSEKL